MSTGRVPPTVALAMLLKQTLTPDRSCQRAVNGWIVQCVAEGWLGRAFASFDQWSVELGKKLADRLIPAVQEPLAACGTSHGVLKLLGKVARWQT